MLDFIRWEILFPQVCNNRFARAVRQLKPHYPEGNEVKLVCVLIPKIKRGMAGDASVDTGVVPDFFGIALCEDELYS